MREDLKGPPTLAEDKPKVEKDKPKIEDKPQVEEDKPKEEAKPIKKRKVIKKIVYQEASSYDSDGADEVEYVKVKNNPKQK